MLVQLSLLILAIPRQPTNQDSMVAESVGEVLLPPIPGASAPTVGLVVIGRADVSLESYISVASAIQETLRHNSSLVVAIRSDAKNLNETLARFKTSFNVTHTFLLGHSMTDGGIVVQDVANASPSQFSGIILLEAFLQRKFRPDIVDCLPKAAIQPKRSFSCPLGCLADGSRVCTGPNTVAFPLPVLTVAGELDGVVRITRIAEALYTQRVLSDRQSDYFTVIRGLNHASIINGTVPPLVAMQDLSAERGLALLVADVASTVASFVLLQTANCSTARAHLDALQGEAEDFFDPIIDAFVVQEGNWFFTGADEEHGQSAWAGAAQLRMASPLPPNTTWSSTPENHFFMTPDEENIPPYYRNKHRANVTFVRSADGRIEYSSSNVGQLRFIKLSLLDTQAGLNGWAIIKEEKVNILDQFLDDGSIPESAIEIATKLTSRQYVYNISGFASPVSLDDGDRCKGINADAYAWAKSVTPAATLSRFEKIGRPLVMVADKKPKIAAGPFWIWSYLEYNDKGSSVEVASYASFVSVDGNPYGAGTHYCKLLSPARAVEWIYVDGLRKGSI